MVTLVRLGLRELLHHVRAEGVAYPLVGHEALPRDPVHDLVWVLPPVRRAEELAVREGGDPVGLGVVLSEPAFGQGKIFFLQGHVALQVCLLRGPCAQQDDHLGHLWAPEQVAELPDALTTAIRVRQASARVRADADARERRQRAVIRNRSRVLLGRGGGHVHQAGDPATLAASVRVRGRAVVIRAQAGQSEGTRGAETRGGTTDPPDALLAAQAGQSELNLAAVALQHVVAILRGLDILRVAAQVSGAEGRQAELRAHAKLREGAPRQHREHAKARARQETYPLSQ
mmetsp:Transcript_18514/g.49694  ORF Transcript_18514/g.49694 Transcript_18514/m.49694 type:complete len:287 (-) Transcript_18514:8-868(-)